MGSLFKSSSAKQSTSNQQVGVQGTGAIGQSGTVGGSQAASGAVALGNITGTGQTINITSSDIAALESNQAIATTAINAANITSIHALETLQMGQNNAAALIAQTQAGANQVALAATPVSAGEVATAATATLKPILTVAVVAAVVIGGIIIVKNIK